MADSKRSAPAQHAVEQLIERFDLSVHPEGGWYRELWRSPVVLAPDALPAGYPGARSLATSILYLLPAGMESRPHRVRSEELWLHHQGDDLELCVSRVSVPDSALGATPSAQQTVLLGQRPPAVFQAIVPALHVQSARPRPGPAGYALAACVVVPGFDFEDFEMLAG